MIEQTTPLVSVITPAYNASPFLGRLVSCVQAQTGITYEHIIVDDASIDDTGARLAEYATSDDRIRVITCRRNVGVVQARNLAITEARGRFLAFLDADDAWLPGKLRHQVDFMLSKSAAISYTDYRFMSADGARVGRILKGPGRVGWHFHHMTRYLGCLTIMIDRAKCPDFSFGSVSSEYRAEDFLAWSKVLKQHRYAYRCPLDLARYAVVENSRSSDGRRAAKSVWRLYVDVEGLPRLWAAFYFLCYVVFSTAKRYLCRPRWPAEKFDSV